MKRREQRVTTAKFTHLNPAGQARMVSVQKKATSARYAKARARVYLPQIVFDAALQGRIPKGDLWGAARIAGILAAKKTPDLIPLCHPLAINHVGIEIRPSAPSEIEIICEASCEAKTGVEMEAMTGAAVAALTIVDMCKSVHKGVKITEVVLLEKLGGKSGHYRLKD